MHDLLSFMPRPRMNATVTRSVRQIVGVLIDDIQVLATHDRDHILRVIAQFAHEQRARMQEEEQHGRL